MTFAEKLKELRKKTHMSQETLAEKLGVSRQAVTKWETDRGIPDISNMMMISSLFGISVDEFLSEEKSAVMRKGYLYESTTEYDIDGVKSFDMKLGGAAKVIVIGSNDEKIKVRLASDTLKTLKQDFKVKIDDVKKRIDIDVKRMNKMTEATAKSELLIEIILPNKYLSHVELNVNCMELHLNHLECNNIEFTGKTVRMNVDSVSSMIEVNCNLDMNIICQNLNGSFNLNQISATSEISIPKNFRFRTIVKGIANFVSYQKQGKVAEDFSDEEAENIIELNGMKSELLIQYRED
ncbi:MAG: helix-turn-helix domain-containing protein [Oscillospiraceae bacterium]|nr:helix-turn-helix domain-containing protein [Oscillospiraceae bacterium]MDE6707924.1 helix-turn-helix domain-containing protein [Oscillospiraceae bacterium]